MQGRNIDPSSMGISNQVQNDLTNDNGETIRASNLTVNPEQAENAFPVGIASSNCILISNMFDANQVDLERDPTFYVDIKNSVSECVSAWGQIDQVYIE